MLVPVEVEEAREEVLGAFEHAVLSGGAGDDLGSGGVEVAVVEEVENAAF